MEQVMDTMRDAGSRVLAALCETGKAVAGFVTGVVKSVSCAVAGQELFPGQKEIK